MKEKKVETTFDAVVTELATPVASWTPFFPSETLDAILASVRTNDVRLKSRTKSNKYPLIPNDIRFLPAVIVITLILVYARTGKLRVGGRKISSSSFMGRTYLL